MKKTFLEKKVLIPQSKFWRWSEIAVVVIGILNSVSAAIMIIVTSNKKNEYIDEFLQSNDLISLVVIKYWGVYLLVTVCGVAIMWFINKTKELPFVFGFSISLVYLLCAVWMTFSSISVMTQLEKFANA